MIILKLGGSILTKKSSTIPQIDSENLERIAKEIKKSLDNHNKKLIIVHGAGSFGHPPAKKYNIGKIFKNEEYPLKRIGFSTTQNAVKKLNTEICKVFIDNKLPVVTIQPSTFITTSNGRINYGNLDLIKKYLDEDYIPVLYGDVVLDDKLKMAVLSGDQIIQYLAMNLESDRIILGTDVDGVYNKNPKTNDDAILFERFNSMDELDSLDSTTNVDVTGGMIGKIKELLELADIGIDSKIINVNKKDFVYKALENEDIKGTVISKK
ncbi:isopentenyl phosphate kinase family protein [Methanobrevibacter sp. OttesenSCG-928-I08]|nr:isopentenyl phosphate kinase family protein [Methanobrevibacter sp. OttesenSCG-928-I08]